jgi:hypothetical protein
MADADWWTAATVSLKEAPQVMHEQNRKTDEGPAAGKGSPQSV